MQAKEEKINRNGKRNFWDKIAKSYNKKFTKEYKTIFKELFPLIGASDSVCELGCGPGLVSFRLSQKCKNVVGIDLSTEMIRVANEIKEREQYNNVKFHVFNAQNFSEGLGEGQSKFDKVLLCNLLHVAGNPIEILKDSQSLLKKEGETIVITYCHGEKKRGLQNILVSKGMSILNKLGKIPDFHKFTFINLRNLCSASGFCVKEEFKIGGSHDFPCLLLLLKKNP